MANTVQNTSGGTTVSFNNTPQAADDNLISSLIGLTEDSRSVVYLNVMGNDLGGNAKALWSVDNGINNSGAMNGFIAGDLLTQDVARTESLSTDTSLNGAKIWITSDGKVGYDSSTLSATFAAKLQALAAGEDLTDSFIYSIRLGNGTLSWATATVHFAGVNDAPVITSTAAAAAGSAKEDTTLSATGQLSASDVDHGATQTWSVQGNATGVYGSLAVDGANGKWTYTLDNSAAAVQAMAIGESHTENFTVRVTDDQGASAADQTVIVTVTGTNDAPMLAAADVTGAVTEPVAPLGMLSDSGTIPFTDVDITDVHHVSVASVGSPYGSLAATITADTTGSGTGGQLTWTYSIPASVVDILAQGEIKTESFDVTVDDGNGGVSTRKVDVTITGTNDTPVISAQLSASASEGSGILPLYLLAGASDVDQGSVLHATNLVWAEGGSGLPAGFTRNADSLYVDTSNPAYDSLAQGSSYVAHIGYDVTDQFGASVHQTAVVTINGVNDAPVAQNDTNAITVTALASQAHTNTVNWVDWTSATATGTETIYSPVFGWQTRPIGTVSGTIDLGNGQTVGVTYSGEYAFTQTNGGTYYYTGPTGSGGTYTSAAVANAPPNSDIIGLFLAKSPRTLTFSQPVDNLFFAVVSLNGNGYIFDQDFQVASYGPGYWGNGTLTRQPIGNGTYEVVGSGEPHGVLRIDGSVQTLTWTSAADEYWNGFTVGTYGKALTATASGNLLVNDSDVEHDPLSVTAANGQPIVGNSVTLSLASGARVQVNKDGTYLYDENSAFGSLGQNQTKQDGFQYTVSDGHGGTSSATATITITGVNDGPVANNDTAVANEDTSISIAVLANDTDVDAGDSKTLVNATGASHGAVAVSGGNVIYTPAANYSGADSFTYTMKDAAGAPSTATVNVTVNPVTDTYVLSNLASNGSFEQFGSGGTSAGSTAITGWTVIGSDVDRVASSGWQSGDGTYSLDLNGFHPGGVQQVLPTTPGVQYTVGFDLSKNPGNTTYATVQVSAAGNTQSYTFNAANSATNMMWSQQTFTFMATGTSTTLSFASTYPTDSTGGFPVNAQGPALDEVVVFANKTIGNFTKGVGGDVLQLHDLMTSVSAPHDTTAFSGGFLRFLQSGSDTLVQIDANGGGDAYLTVATLIGQSLTQTDTPNYVL